MKRKQHGKPAHDNGEVVLSHEEIRERAHRIYLARGTNPGSEMDDWLRAERELKKERAAKRAGLKRLSSLLLALLFALLAGCSTVPTAEGPDPYQYNPNTGYPAVGYKHWLL